MRCPIHMAQVREMVAGRRSNAPGADAALLARADRIVANATFADRAGLAEHLVVSHGWRPYTGTLRESKP